MTSEMASANTSHTPFKPPKATESLKDENNYSSWSMEVKMLLRLADLDMAIDSVEGIAPQPLTKSYQHLSDKALATIMANCDSEPLSLIRISSSALSAWNTLKSHYEGRTRTH
ncbi:hypothetical protein L211DRAFT_838296, partial [Terfezia boudieri ATCC MYA-4762]